MRMFKFIKEVATEAKKVIWPKPKDTMLVVGVVVVAVFISSIFFLCADYIIYSAIDFFLNFKG